MAINKGKFPEKVGGCVSGLWTEGLAFCLRKETSLFITEKEGDGRSEGDWGQQQSKVTLSMSSISQWH